MSRVKLDRSWRCKTGRTVERGPGCWCSHWQVMAWHAETERQSAVHDWRHPSMSSVLRPTKLVSSLLILRPSQVLNTKCSPPSHDVKICLKLKNSEVDQTVNANQCLSALNNDRECYTHVNTTVTELNWHSTSHSTATFRESPSQPLHKQQ